LSDVADHWDSIYLRSWVKFEGERRLFQESTLDAMLAPDDLISRIKDLLVDPADMQGLVVYSGTVASLFSVDYSPYFEVEMDDPVLGRKITDKYSMTCVSQWYKG
jgi:hypothetical protein